MQIIYGLDINNTQYLVLDYNESLMNSRTIASLAAYRGGIGADKVIFMDMVNGAVIAIYNAEGQNTVPDMDDFKAARKMISGSFSREYHVTDYYLSTIVVEKELIKTAC
ncbi:MAG: hypothetical protein K6C05_00600 [Anaerovibrio sp.]|uniref:hypothetical protein n=1 Tax=Anaerovibrio sp. TaxID=1872532 RepID=UPI0025F4CC05|nr:hypothetical protein [Anaerovibrio sp.]MCR5175327.1 hypothetical protein [Anaerovibrio sp.]